MAWPEEWDRQAIPAIQKVQRGELCWTSVDIVDIDAGTQGVALRSALDEFLVQVRRVPIWQPRHLLTLLSGDEPVAPYVILCCHGVNGGILLPELADHLEGVQPVHRILTAESLRDRVHLPERTVIATGCGTGDPALAQAFLAGGCATYIAPTGGPYINSVIVAVTLLFFGLMRGRTLAESMDRVRHYDDELSMWQLWNRGASAGS